MLFYIRYRKFYCYVLLPKKKIAIVGVAVTILLFTFTEMFVVWFKPPPSAALDRH